MEVLFKRLHRQRELIVLFLLAVTLTLGLQVSSSVWGAVPVNSPPVSPISPLSPWQYIPFVEGTYVPPDDNPETTSTMEQAPMALPTH